MENQASTPSAPARAPGFLDRKMTLRWVLILLGVVVVAGLVLWALKALECGRIAADCRERLRESTAQCAEDVARAIAVVGNRQIVDARFESLQDYADNLVRHKPIAYIAIVDVSGKAVVHTDRKLLGKPWKAPEQDGKTVTAWVPVMDYTNRVGAVYVGAAYAP